MLIRNKVILLCSDSLELLLFICLLIIVRNTGFLIWSPIADEDLSGVKGIAQSIVGKVEIQLKENSVTDLFILAFFFMC